jgi:hypothetical protein
MKEVSPWEGEDERPLKADIYLLTSVLLLVEPRNSYRYTSQKASLKGVEDKAILYR